MIVGCGLNVEDAVATVEAVRAADGTVTDVTISYPLDLTAQMLEYSGRRP